MPTLSAFRECRRHGRQQGHGHEQHGHLFGRDFRPGVWESGLHDRCSRVWMQRPPEENLSSSSPNSREPASGLYTRPLTAAFATFRALLLGCLRGGPCVTQILFQESSEPVQLELGLRLDKRAKQREKDAEKKQGAPAPLRVGSSSTCSLPKITGCVGGKLSQQNWQPISGTRLWVTVSKTLCLCCSNAPRALCSEICLSQSCEEIRTPGDKIPASMSWAQCFQGWFFGVRHTIA